MAILSVKRVFRSGHVTFDVTLSRREGEGGQPALGRSGMMFIFSYIWVYLVAQSMSLQESGIKRSRDK